MARVTLVVNSIDEGSETFLHGLGEQLVAVGHTVTVHALLQGRTTMVTGASYGPAERIARSSALPAARSRTFVPSVLRLVAGQRRAVLEVGRRSVERFGRTARGARAAALAAPLAATRPDVVHAAFSGIGVALVDAIELLPPDTRSVVSCRGTGELVAPVLDEALRPPLERTLRRADAVHAVADVVADAAIGWGAASTRVRVIRPAVDTDLFRRREPRRAPGRPFRVVTVARLHWIKAVDLQLTSLAALRSRGLDVEWLVVGDGPDRAALEFRSRVLGVADRVRFLGSCTPERVRDVVGSADAFVLSSLSEGTANSVLEAMALEVPVVSSGAGGMGEVLTDGVDALVVPPGDPVALAAAVERVMADPVAAAAMAASGRRTVVERHSLERQREQWADLYRSVLDPTPDPRGSTR